MQKQLNMYLYQNIYFYIRNLLFIYKDIWFNCRVRETQLNSPVLVDSAAATAAAEAAAAATFNDHTVYGIRYTILYVDVQWAEA